MKEKVVIVNKYDTIIWHKYRDELKFGEDIYRVAILRIENDKKEILLSQRAFTRRKQARKRWVAVAGMVSQWEDYQDTIEKETKEELWISLKEYTTWPKQFVENWYWGTKYYVQRFITTINKSEKEFTVEKKEIEKVQWFSQAQLFDMIKHNTEKFTANAPEYIPMMIEYTENMDKK